MQILIVDDEYLEIDQLCHLINKRYSAWTVFRSEDIANSIQIASSHTLDLAILDIALSGESGLDLADELLNIHPSMSILIVSAYQNFKFAKRALQMRAIDYIVKPVIESEFYASIDKIANKNQSHPSYLSSILKEAIHYIDLNFRENIHLNDVAEYVHVTPNYLSKKFQNELHVSYKEYLIKARINAAKKLLLECPDYSIQMIANQVGFYSQNHFTNSFKKYEAQTPTQFKNEERGYHA
ncbi:response regulator transcription factor [Sporolactobacillus nakayamae]|uniref:Response regulator receiver domain-containing protein n=1 Tax=Sporolactobacillus nakayamae TaxID=269670 RepID=A0A1I2PKD7_9BACL|nr:response regulator transcription factor [Sporolactobacillus nakayamae]SFG16524.1 Response regulator receiver domain-containing protein [Sporolactobacillus nakayamae]